MPSLIQCAIAQTLRGQDDLQVLLGIMRHCYLAEMAEA
jgi:hypothetical protein